MHTKYNVVIIGAGIGGLVCGSYLAKAGLKVLIVEKNDKPGGCCTSFKRNGFRFDAGVHAIGSCNENGVLYRILKNINVKQTFIRMNPTDRFFFPEDKIEVPNQLDKYILLLQQYFPKEKININNFFEELLKIARNIKSAHYRYNKISYQNFLDIYFRDIKLKSVLSAQSGFLGLIPKDVSAVSMCAMLSSYLKDGAYYPIGGAGSLSSNLAMAFEQYGGRIIFNSTATKLIIKDKKIVGVVTKSRKDTIYDIYSDIIVSNIDATQTFFELLGGDLTNESIKDNIKQSTETPSLFILYLGIKGDKKAIEENVGWHYPQYDVNNNLNKCIYVTSPSLYDDTAADNGINIIEAFEIFPYEYDNIRNWEMCRKELEEKLLSKLSKFIPGVEDRIVIKESATPKTIKNYTFNKNGAPYGWALTSGQYNRNNKIWNRLDPNLYLTGHWTNPGGGILTVAISGYTTAKKILRA